MQTKQLKLLYICTLFLVIPSFADSQAQDNNSGEAVRRFERQDFWENMTHPPPDPQWFPNYTETLRLEVTGKSDSNDSESLPENLTEDQTQATITSETNDSESMTLSFSSSTDSATINNGNDAFDDQLTPVTVETVTERDTQHSQTDGHPAGSSPTKGQKEYATWPTVIVVIVFICILVVGTYCSIAKYRSIKREERVIEEKCKLIGLSLNLIHLQFY